ncbi:MAG: glycosyl hydrolase [Pseudomonadota bacterium]
MAASFGLTSAHARPDTDRVDRVVETMTWRNIGPNVGGRSIAVAGSTSRPYEAYFGATGGGLWKTSDGGTNWRPVTDGQINSSSVGAVAVAPSNPDTVFIGMGEGQLRGNVMQGDGVYKSSDAGKTWTHAGLPDSRTISTIRIHPTNPNLVYAAVLGDPFSDHEERGLYRTRDGGETWEKILFVSKRAGVIDITMDPDDPNHLFATSWEVYRRPWKLWSGGDGSRLFETKDGGNSWSDITDRPGLPDGPLGKMTVAISPADANRVYANIEAKEGGLYRSDDAGQTWTHINGARKLWQRSFYFMQVRPDPVDRDRVYVLSFKLERSDNGGETFTSIPTQHADIHDLWIDPKNHERMIVGDDGGGSVTVNGGATWTEQDFSTAQIYRVTTTNDFPYHVCGAQQDNLAVCVASQTRAGSGSSIKDRYSGRYTVAPSEMGYIASHPEQPGVFYTGATNGLLRYDRETDRTSDVFPFPYWVMGQTAASMKERWNWTYPIVFSQRPPHPLYVGSQHLWKSEDEGQSWTKVSPDLTRADASTLGETGGVVLLDQDGPEVYGTLYTIAPSHFDQKVIWTGSDDGLIHVTQDGGKNWKNVTPPDVSANSRISLIEASHHDPATAYVAVKRYEMGDRKPYIFYTDDFGQSWTSIIGNLGAETYVHAIREDPEVADLLYIGTEHGAFFSQDRGRAWKPLSTALPDVHVSSLEVKGDDLIAATHGRGFYILEGLDLLRRATKSEPGTKLLAGAPGIRRFRPASFFIDLESPVDAATLEIVDASGANVTTLFKDKDLDTGGYRFDWRLHHKGAAIFEGMILESPNPVIGPAAAPGQYTAKLSFGDTVLETPFEVEFDPRVERDLTAAEARDQTKYALRARDATHLANSAVIEIRKIRKQFDDENCSEASRCGELLNSIAAIEKRLYQVKNESPKDKIAYPIQLNDRLAGLLATFTYSDGPATDAQKSVLSLLESELDDVLSDFEGIKATHQDLVAKGN